MDSAAVAFTRAFYLALLCGDTVKHSFDIARQALKSSPYVPDSVLEGEKFILLPEYSNESTPENVGESPSVDGASVPIRVPSNYHDVRIFNGRSINSWPEMPSQCSMSNQNLPIGGNNISMLSNSILTQPLPSPPPDFEGREVDIHRVIMTLFSRRLVSVVGEDGVGKSSLSAAVCNYLSDRCVFEDGIFYSRCQGIFTHEALLKALHGALLKSTVKMNTRVRTFASTMNATPFSMSQSNQFSTINQVTADKEDSMYMMEELIVNCFGSLRCLLVLDHINELLRSDDAVTDLKMFLSRVFSKCKFIKILLTSTESLSSGVQQLSSGLIEYSVKLGPLSLRNSLRLFAKLTPVLVTSESKMSFVSTLLANKLSSNVQAAILSLLGDGHPGVIVKMASEYDKDAVTRLHFQCLEIIEQNPT